MKRLPTPVLTIAPALLALAITAGAIARQQQDCRGEGNTPAAGGSKLPEGLAGDWFWGTISPTRYRDRDTGELIGHGYSGALSYVFKADGTYERYFYLETRLGGDVSSIFSASEGTVTFSGDKFTLKPAKGTYRFLDGPRKKPRERAMRQDELERPGLVFTWRLERKDGEPAVLMVGKEGEDPRAFQRSADEAAQ